MSRRGENIYKRKDGRYEGRFVKGYSAEGRAIYGSVYAHTYAEVREKLCGCKSGRDEESKGCSLTVESFLELWINGLQNVKDTTREVYKGHIDNHIVPELGRIKLKNLRGEDIQRLVSSLKMSPSTVKVVFCVLRSALESAEERGYIQNVWSKVKLPKKQRREVNILTAEEQKRLENALCEDNDIGILICLYTGLRIGELCALRWRDVNPDKPAIRISSTQARVGGQVKFLPPKSQTSARTIPVPQFLMDKICALKRDGEFVLSNNGSFVDVRTYRRRFKRLLADAGLPDIKFHALRHTFATRALEVGMDFKTLSEVLGHSTVAITMDLYVHSLDEHKKNQMNKLCQIYSPSNQPSDNV